MATYAYTIYDGDPDQSGPCSWPDSEDVAIEAENAVRAADRALGRACTEARGLPSEYAPTDRLWVLVTDSDGVTHKRSCEVG